MPRFRARVRAVGAVVAALLAGAGKDSFPERSAHADSTADVHVELPEDGRLASFVLSGPYEPKRAPKGARIALGERPDGMPEPPKSLDALVRASCTDCPSRPLFVAATGGVVDVRDQLKPHGEALAYASVGLTVRNRSRAHLLLGADDGVRVHLDGQAVYTRDEPRPPRDDDDAVPLDLTAGEHVLTVELHQHDGAWQISARLVGETFLRASDVTVHLPGALRGVSAYAPAPRIGVRRTLDPTGLFLIPSVQVSFPDGYLANADRHVRARLSRDGKALFEADAGLAAPLGTTRVSMPPSALERGFEPAKLEVTVGTTREEAALAPSPAVLASLSLAARVLDSERARPPELVHARTTAKMLAERLRGFVAEGDTDVAAQELEARDLEEIAHGLETGIDTTFTKKGVSRRAFVSRADGSLSEVGVYVPASFRPEGTRRYPLVVALHGLNGKPMQMVRWFFGKDDDAHDGAWEDRHPTKLDPIDAFVIGPSGHGNGMYRELGEDDVMEAIAWAKSRYPIDDSRVSITGPSMGGIGAAAIPLRHPFAFSAAAPFCGYHSTFVRRDVVGKRLRPWERFLGEERSNADWAPNGGGLPLYIVHGTLDTPEENSKVLIDRYESLHISVKHEHPVLGHNVWQSTYEKPETSRWLLSRRAQLHPRWVGFRTARTRWNTSAWVTVRALAKPDAWGEVIAHAVSKGRIVATTHDVAEVAFARDAELFPGPTVEVVIDRTRLVFDSGEDMSAVRDGTTWKRGHAPSAIKRGTVTGPFRDVFHEPLLFVYGTQDPAFSAVNERVARSFARVRPGVTVSYPVISDEEFAARGETLGNEHPLFLVGSARSNRVLRELEKKEPFPLHVDGAKIGVGSTWYEGRELGAAFVRPNPVRPDRYVAVVFGATPEGTLRALSLPDLLPDFVVYDAAVGQARGQLVLGSAQVRAAGFFGIDWSLPKTFADPYGVDVPTAKNEHEASPYLP